MRDKPEMAAMDPAIDVEVVLVDSEQVTLPSRTLLSRMILKSLTEIVQAAVLVMVQEVVAYGAINQSGTVAQVVVHGVAEKF